MTTVIKFCKTVDTCSLRDWRKMFWQLLVNWVIVRKTYIEKKRESPIGSDDSHITDTNTSPSVFYGEILVG